MNDIEIGVAALSDYDEDNHLQIQIDSPGIDGSEGTHPAEALSPNGVHSRPLDPDKGPKGEVGLGEGMLIITMGDRRYVLPIGDPRDVAEGRVPKLKKGGKQLVGGAGSYRSFINIDGEDPSGAKQPGSVMISASYAKNGAKKSLGLSFNVRDAGSEDISLVHGDGARVTVDKDGTTISAPDGSSYIQVSNDGAILAGTSTVQGALTVGQQLAADQVVLFKPLLAVLTQLCSILAATGPSASGAPAASLVPMLRTLGAQHLKST